MNVSGMKFENPHQKQIDEIAMWANQNLYKVKDGDFSVMETMPKVGYIGWANAWSWAEIALLHSIQSFLRKAGLNPRDYFWYQVDSSG